MLDAAYTPAFKGRVYCLLGDGSVHVHDTRTDPTRVVEKWAPRTSSARDSPTCIAVCSGHHVMQGWGAEGGSGGGGGGGGGPGSPTSGGGASPVPPVSPGGASSPPASPAPPTSPRRAKRAPLGVAVLMGTKDGDVIVADAGANGRVRGRVVYSQHQSYAPQLVCFISHQPIADRVKPRICLT